jgi:Tol biopolymer transport system component
VEQGAGHDASVVARWIVDRLRERSTTADQELFLIRPDGTGLTPLTHNDALDWAPAWSPDGTSVAFTSSLYSAASRRNQQLLVIIDVRTRERTRTAISPAFELHPDWRPN